MNLSGKIAIVTGSNTGIGFETAMIEIDLRQNLGESLEDIPKQFPVIFDAQM